MPTVRERVQHEIHRWSYMTRPQLRARLDQMSVLEKLIITYVVSMARGERSLAEMAHQRISTQHGSRGVDRLHGMRDVILQMYRDAEESDDTFFEHIQTSRNRVRSGAANMQSIPRSNRDVIGAIEQGNAPDFSDTPSLNDLRSDEDLVDGDIQRELQLAEAIEAGNKRRHTRRIRFKKRKAKPLVDGWSQPLLGEGI